jgi:hypothetical protein
MVDSIFVSTTKEREMRISGNYNSFNPQSQREGGKENYPAGKPTSILFSLMRNAWQDEGGLWTFCGPHPGKGYFQFPQQTFSSVVIDRHAGAIEGVNGSTDPVPILGD